MTNNDILRRLRYALNLNNRRITALFALGGHPLSEADLDLILRKEDDPQSVDCPDVLLSAFLDGLIISRRGPGGASGDEELNNNAVLRKLRIALELKDTDMLGILREAGLKLSKSELAALFRRPEHRNFKQCGDQLLRKFLTGLARTSREKITSDGGQAADGK